MTEARGSRAAAVARRSASACSVLVLGLCLTASSAWSQGASYQGRLVDASGAPLTGPLTLLELKIYNSSEAGASLYEELHTNVPLSDGLFSVLLGDGVATFASYDTTLFPSNEPRYLEVSVNGELLSPRQQIGTVPTALVAKEWAGGGSCPAGQSIRVISGDGRVTCEPHTLDTNTQLSEAQVDTFVANNNFSTGAHTTDTQLTSAQVAAAALAQGFVTGAHTVDTDTTYTAGSGLSLAGTTFSANTAQVQARVSGSCAVGHAISAIAANGTVTCGAVDPAPAIRFEACSDGLTVADHDTGLLWERKTGTVGSGVICSSFTGGCPDPHDVLNLYAWSASTATGPLPHPNDGNAYTDFLARLNGGFDPDVATGCFANRCDWRLPEIAELQTILIGPEAAPGQATTCSVPPCTDPDFTVGAGSTSSSDYWSASSGATSPFRAWAAGFGNGGVVDKNRAFDSFVRAVRAGSCGS